MHNLKINLAVIGTVSSGKTTCINMMFAEQYANPLIKKSTMAPYLYHVNKNLNIKYDLPENINKANSKNDKEILKKVNTGEKVSYDEKEYFVPCMYDLIDPNENLCLTVYDTPGFNDSKTKDIYFKYINNNFYNFDVVIWIIDINSSMNTFDEMEGLLLILNNISEKEKLYGISTKFIILMNKCDDMTLNNEQLELDEELSNLLEQAKNIIEEQVNKIDPSIAYTIMTISCENSYIYRLCQKNKIMNNYENSELNNPKYFNKLGTNECGKSAWNSMNDLDKKNKITEIILNINYESRLKTSGFKNFKNYMQTIFKPENQCAYLINHIKYELKVIETNCSNDDNDPLVELNKLHEIRDRMNVILGMCNIRAIPIRLLFEKTIKNFIDSYYSKNVKKYVSYFNNLGFEELLEQQAYKKLVLSKQFYETFAKLFDDNTYQNIVEIISKSINKYLIHCIEKNNNYTIEKYLSIVDNLIENKCDSWKKILFYCVLTKSFVKEIPIVQAEKLENMCEKYKLSNNEMISIIFKILDKIYVIRLHTNKNNLILTTKFWNDIFVKSCNKYSIPIYNIRKILNISTENQMFTNEHKNNVQVETCLYKYLKIEYPNDFFTVDDILNCKFDSNEKNDDKQLDDIKEIFHNVYSYMNHQNRYDNDVCSVEGDFESPEHEDISSKPFISGSNEQDLCAVVNKYLLENNFDSNKESLTNEPVFDKETPSNSLSVNPDMALSPRLNCSNKEFITGKHILENESFKNKRIPFSLRQQQKSDSESFKSKRIPLPLRQQQRSDSESEDSEISNDLLEHINGEDCDQEGPETNIDYYCDYYNDYANYESTKHKSQDTYPPLKHINKLLRKYNFGTIPYFEYKNKAILVKLSDFKTKIINACYNCKSLIKFVLESVNILNYDSYEKNMSYEIMKHLNDKCSNKCIIMDDPNELLTKYNLSKIPSEIKISKNISSELGSQKSQRFEISGFNVKHNNKKYNKIFDKLLNLYLELVRAHSNFKLFKKYISYIVKDCSS